MTNWGKYENVVIGGTCVISSTCFITAIYSAEVHNLQLEELAVGILGAWVVRFGIWALKSIWEKW